MANQRFTELQSVARFSNYIPKPSHYYDPKQTSNILIISTNDNETRVIPGIYEYNISKNTMKRLMKYPSRFGAHRHGQFIDPQTHKLFLFGGGSTQRLCVGYDLQTGEYRRERGGRSQLTQLEQYVITLQIPSDTNPEIHCMDEAQTHFKYQIQNENVTKINADLRNMCDIGKQRWLYRRWMRHPKLAFVESNNKRCLMVFGGNRQNSMFYTDSMAMREWKRHALTMPYSVDWCFYDVLLGFKNVVFVFYFPYNDPSQRYIWCFDILLNKWHKTEYEIPMSINAVNNIYVLKTERNVADIMDFRSGIHLKVNLFDLLPRNLQKEHQIYYEPLVMGYVRQMEKAKRIPLVPFPLKKLVCLFYPSFV